MARNDEALAKAKVDLEQSEQDAISECAVRVQTSRSPAEILKVIEGKSTFSYVRLIEALSLCGDNYLFGNYHNNNNNFVFD